jgi:hypothetical protein
MIAAAMVASRARWQSPGWLRRDVCGGCGSGLWAEKFWLVWLTFRFRLPLGEHLDNEGHRDRRGRKSERVQCKNAGTIYGSENGTERRAAQLERPRNDILRANDQRHFVCQFRDSHVTAGIYMGRPFF